MNSSALGEEIESRLEEKPVSVLEPLPETIERPIRSCSQWTANSRPLEMTKAARWALQIWSMRVHPLIASALVFGITVSAVSHPNLTIGSILFCFGLTFFLLHKSSSKKDAIDEILGGLDAPSAVPLHVVRIGIFRDGTCLGTDLGTVCFESGWLIFEGKRTRFSVSAADISSVLSEDIRANRRCGIPANYSKILELMEPKDWHQRVGLELVGTCGVEAWTEDWPRQFAEWRYSQIAHKQGAILPPKTPMRKVDLLITARMFELSPSISWYVLPVFATKTLMELVDTFVHSYHNIQIPAVTDKSAAPFSDGAISSFTWIFLLATLITALTVRAFQCMRQRRELERIEKETS